MAGPGDKYKKEGDPSIKIGDTVLMKDGTYAIAAGIKPKVNTYKDNPNMYKWDEKNPIRSIDATSSILDKQNIASAVQSEVKKGYAAKMAPAFNSILNMLDDLQSSGKITKDEVYTMLAPKHLREDPFGSRKNLDEWAKKYDPDYFKNTIHDKEIYKDVKKYKKAVEEKGEDFFIARTNVGRQVKYEFKNGKPVLKPVAQYGSKEDLLSTVIDSWNLEELKKENYTSTVLNRVADYVRKNSSLGPVQRAFTSTNLAASMADAELYSLVLQDVKDFRTKAKEKIVNYMYNDLRADDDDGDELRIQTKQEFATPMFDKNNKFIGYNYDQLRFQLDKSFDAAGNFDANYIPYTNYQERMDRDQMAYDLKGRKIKGLGNRGLVPSDLKDDEGVATIIDIQRQENEFLKDEFKGYDSGLSGDKGKYKWLPMASSSTPEDWEEEIMKDTKNQQGLIGWNAYVSNKGILDWLNPLSSFTQEPYTYYQLTNKGMGKYFKGAFSKAVNKLYEDSSSNNILGIGYTNVPFFQNITAAGGGTGIGAKGLGKKINLDAGENTDAVSIWESFKFDWDNNRLKNKINGADRLISFNGFGTYGYNESLGEDENIGESSDKGVKLMNNFLLWTEEHPGSDFDLEAYKYAAGSFDKSAMIVRFPKKFLKEQVEKEKVIDEADLNLIEKNGLSIIAGSNDFSNELIKAQRTPLQLTVDYRGAYTWSHPTGLATYTIEKNLDGLSGVDYKTVTRYYNTEGKQINQVTNPVTNFGDNLDKALYTAIDQLSRDINKALNNQ
jgi:hypothetical protein